MANITCSNCGKRYDYHDTEFCPKCWLYNRPKDLPISHLEYDLLSKVRGSDAVRDLESRAEKIRTSAGQAAVRAGAAPVRAADAARAPTAAGALRKLKEDPWRTAPKRPPATRQKREDPWKGRRRFTAPAQDPEGRAAGRRGLAVFVIVMTLCLPLLIAAVILINLFVLNQAPRQTGRAARETEAVLNADVARWGHEQWEPFAFDEVEITVEDARYLDIPADSALYRAGERCLLVDVWIEGGTRRDDVHFISPSLQADGAQVALEEGMRTVSRLKEQGVYAVTLRDYQWENPLYGQFVFFLPEDLAAQEVYLLLQECYPGGDEARVKTVHEVAVTLPAWVDAAQAT